MQPVFADTCLNFAYYFHFLSILLELHAKAVSIERIRIFFNLNISPYTCDKFGFLGAAFLIKSRVFLKFGSLSLMTSIVFLPTVSRTSRLPVASCFPFFCYFSKFDKFLNKFLLQKKFAIRQ